jgi:hypothetical protein
MRPRSLLLLSTLFHLSMIPHALPQKSACGAPPAVFESTRTNIFSEQQEQWLGEAMADYIEHEYRPVRNPEENAYLKTIGDRLLAVLPPTKIQFHFLLVESPEVNGFSLAGGRVYLTRKLVASARSEDEVAGVIAHEMGHILSHQFAIETTADLHRLLGVTSVTDRADIYAKFQRLTDARLHDKHATDVDSDDKQDEADRVAVYASAAAGYRAQAYADFWDRSFFVGGKTGNSLGDFFHTTTPSQKRLRRLRGIVGELPPGCDAATNKTSVAFDHWHTMVLEDQVAPLAKPAATARPTDRASVQLNPPLHLNIERLRFSRNGQYLLAQDESSIFILSRNPFKELFRFSAEHALPADFTPDSTQVAFYTPDLHVERWDIAQQKLVSAHDVVTPENCLQTLLSPDARTLFCIAYPEAEVNLRILLLDVETGQVVFENKNWFRSNFNIETLVLLRQLEKDTKGVLTSALSADGNTLLLGPGSDRLAFDLRTRAPIKISGALTSYDFPVSYCFQGNNRIVAIHGSDAAHSGLFSFPDGKRLQSLKLGLPFMDATSTDGYVTTSGSNGSVINVIDVNAAKFVLGSKSSAIDIFQDSFAIERTDGSIALGELSNPNSTHVLSANMPLSPLAPVLSAAISPDGRYLALSARTRGAVWDLTTGSQIFLVRGFRSSWWSPEGKLLAEFTSTDKAHPAIIGELTPEPRLIKSMTYELPERAHLQNNHLFEWKSQNKRGWTLTAYSPVDLAVKWTRQFPDGRPAYTSNFGDTDLIFSDLLQSSAAKEKLRSNPVIRQQADTIKQKIAGRLIEIVNAEDGAVRAQVVVELPLTYENVDGFNALGDLLYLSTGDNRTIVYSLKTGAQLRQIYGSVVAADTASQTVCTQNRRNEITVLDRAGVELLHLTLDAPLRFAQLRSHGAQLLVLTADQRVGIYAIPNKPPVNTASNQ